MAGTLVVEGAGRVGGGGRKRKTVAGSVVVVGYERRWQNVVGGGRVEDGARG